MARWWVGLLAGRADRLSRLVLEAYHVPVEQRVARRLLEVGRLFAAERLPVVVPLTQEEVAQLAGTRRRTANQVGISYREPVAPSEKHVWIITERNRPEPDQPRLRVHLLRHPSCPGRDLAP